MAARRSDLAAALGALALASVVGLLLAAQSVSLRGVQIGLGVALVAIAFTLDDDAQSIPRVLRPAPLILLSALVGSLSIGLLTDEDYEGAYVWMWLCQISGFLLAIVWRPKLSDRLKSAQLAFSLEKVNRYAEWMWWLGVVSAFVFFKAKGVPLLSGGVEQGRVDAASSGTGYLRLLAFMTGPSAILMVAANHNRRWLYVGATALLVTMFGNRVPLVYLGVPIVAMVAIVGTKVKSRHLLGVAVIALAVVAGIGTYRVLTEPEFRSYDEYRQDLAEDDKLGVALTSVTHYSEVIPANAVLVKRLVDDETLATAWGKSYFTLFLSALPGEQLSPDLMIKEASNREFVGGGTPPTLMGEGYLNFGYPGIVIGSFLVMWLARRFASVAIQTRDDAHRRVNAALYGYVITWCCIAQVAGLAGAATVALAGFIVLVGIRWAAAH